MCPAKKNKRDVSLVIPLHNEAGNIQMLYEEIEKVIRDLPENFEIIFVDDGSKDDTYKILEQICAQDKNVRAIKFKRNFKKAAAYSAGFNYARGDIIITMDGDLQDDPAEIPLFLAKMKEGYDVVTGWKYQGKGPISRALPSKVFNRAVGYISDIKLNDFNCPFKAYRREVLENLKIYGELHRYIPVLAHQKGYNIAEIKIANRPRHYGQSSYGIERLWRGLFDAMTILLISKYGEKPLHFFGFLGLILFLIGFGIDLFVVLRKLFVGVAFGHSMGLLTLGIIVLGASFNFFAVGLILEFILGRMIDPTEQYLVEKVLED